MITCIESFIILKDSKFKEAFGGGRGWLHICVSRAQRASQLTGPQPTPQLRRLPKAGCYKAPSLAA